MNTPSRSRSITRRKTPVKPKKTQSRRQSIYPNRSPIETVREKEPKKPTKSKRPVKPRIVMEIMEQEPELEPELELEDPSHDPDRQVREFVAEMMAQNQARADAFVPPVYDPNGRSVLSTRPMPRQNISPILPPLPPRRITKLEHMAIKTANKKYGEFVKLFSVVFNQMREFDVLYNNNQLIISEMTPHNMFSETDPWKHKISEKMFEQILEDMKYVAELNAYVSSIENSMATDPDGFVRSDFKQAMKALHEIHDRMKNILIKSHRPIRA
jgi:hypothetical protein